MHGSGPGRAQTRCSVYLHEPINKVGLGLGFSHSHTDIATSRLPVLFLIFNID